jgi:hypothetical protein
MCCSVSRGEGSDLDLIPTQRGSTVIVNSQAGASIVLASTIAMVLPPFSFGFLSRSLATAS